MNPSRRVLSTVAENRLAMLSALLILALSLFSFVAPLLYRTNQSSPNLVAVNLGPRAAYPLGTDQNGYDILGRLMAGGRSSLEVGLVVGFVSTTIGLFYGAISGYFAGLVDSVLMRLVDIGLAIPLVVLFIFMSEVFKPTLILLMALLVAVSWLIPARLVRGEALVLRAREFVQAGTSMGARSFHIILHHVIPNVIGTIVVTVTFQIANAILTLAVLQFLGFGLPATTPTWGGMLSDGTSFLQDGYWWEVYPALVLIIITVVAFNFVGSALQDAFDVSLQEP